MVTTKKTAKTAKRATKTTRSATTATPAKKSGVLGDLGKLVDKFKIPGIDVAAIVEAAKKGVQQAIANIKELADMEAQTRSKAWKVVQDRFQENLANLQKLLQPK